MSLAKQNKLTIENSNENSNADESTNYELLDSKNATTIKENVCGANTRLRKKQKVESQLERILQFTLKNKNMNIPEQNTYHDTNLLESKEAVEVDSSNKKNWSETELSYLVYFVEKMGIKFYILNIFPTFIEFTLLLIGRSWTEISQKHKIFFNNRPSFDLFRKYEDLEKNVAYLNYLKKKSKTLEEIEIEGRRKSKEKNFYAKWNESECIYLALGVQLYGRCWTLIHSKLKKHFKKHRDANDLCGKYVRLEKNREYLNDLNIKAAALLKSFK